MESHSKNALHSSFHWDGTIIFMTIFYNAILVACGIRPFRDHVIAIEILLFFLFLAPMLFAPIKLKITEQEIKVFRIIGWIKISITDIKSISAIEDDDQFFGKLIRTFGSGGVYGYLGFFKHEKYGKVRMFVTDRKRCFILKMKDGNTFVLSSSKRVDMVNFIKYNMI